MIQIAAYRGTSLISRLIRWQTRSVYSHIGILFTEAMTVKLANGTHIIPAGAVIEAWQGGVRMSRSLSASHEPGTLVDLFEFVTPLDETETMRAARFLCAQLGKPYDYAAIVRFLTRDPENHWNKSKWFCSELAVETFFTVGRNLLERCSAWEIPPRDVPRSPLLKSAGRVVTK